MAECSGSFGPRRLRCRVIGARPGRWMRQRSARPVRASVSKSARSFGSPQLCRPLTTLALDEMAKEEVKKLTGKDDYQAGDLSIELDKRVKASVADIFVEGPCESQRIGPVVSLRCV